MKPVLITLLVAGCVAFGQSRGHGSGPSSAGSARRTAPFRSPRAPVVAHPQHAATAVVPYPVYYGGYYYYDPAVNTALGPGNYDDPNNNAAPSQGPVVIMSQNYRPDSANPSFRDYSDAPLPQAYQAQPDDEQATIYLIALTDHSIVSAIGYWVDGDTLSYITQEGNQNRISLALVDRDFSKTLNDDRHVEFRLPKE